MKNCQRCTINAYRAAELYKVKSNEFFNETGTLGAENKHTYGIEYLGGTIPSSVVGLEGARTRWTVLRIMSFDPNISKA